MYPNLPAKKLSMRDLILATHNGAGYLGHGCRQLGFATESQEEETTAEVVIMRDKAILNAANELGMALPALIEFLQSDLSWHMGEMFLADLEPEELKHIAFNMMMPV